jgi:hypothetical protein
MFADNQVMISNSADTLEGALRELNKIIRSYNF